LICLETFDHPEDGAASDRRYRTTVSTATMGFLTQKTAARARPQVGCVGDDLHTCSRTMRNIRRSVLAIVESVSQQLVFARNWPCRHSGGHPHSLKSSSAT